MLTMTEAAAYLGVPWRSLQHYHSKWGVPGYKFGRSIFFRPDELEAWLQSRRINSTSEDMS